MKLKFKHQAYQANAVESVISCFSGQPYQAGISFKLESEAEQGTLLDSAFANATIKLDLGQILENIKTTQRQQNIPVSSELIASKTSKKDMICPVNLDIEMETGTGKTYCYIKTIFELNKQYGWSKFIIVVPSIAIREGVYKSLEITAEHFLETYGKKARFFIYNSKQLHNLEAFASDSGINIMVINVQAFNATGKDNRRIYEALDDFQSRKPIEVISQTRPILILDEPQKMEGAKTLDSLQAFNALATLRYSATHKTSYNKIHRLDALDAYNQKLVKKIAVRGITVKGLTGTTAYLYFEEIQVSDKPPIARLQFEIKQNDGIKRVTQKVKKNDDLFILSKGLDQYKHFVVSEINANTNIISFTNGVELQVGEAHGDIDEATLRRIQISETIKAHFEKEKELFQKGIKVLSLFFIDEVAKYRQYDENGEQAGEYATFFEEEYTKQVKELMVDDSAYSQYLRGIEASKTHNGYFSIDKKTKRLKNPETSKKSLEADDVDAYDLILKDKERLLSLDEPVRFIFSHSALREGWDNPNVFVICTLKYSDNSISRRQEVGRGLRLAVNQYGERMDDPATVHEINKLTIIANESYATFVSGLQKDISESLSERPRVADENYFTGKVLKTEKGNIEVTPQIAKQIYKYLLKNDYTDDNDNIAQAYHEAKQEQKLAPLPPELEPYSEQVFTLIDSVFSDVQLPVIENERQIRTNRLNDNFYKKEFQALWNNINRKAVYTVKFDSQQLIQKCIEALNKNLRVAKLQYILTGGEQVNQATYDAVKNGESFKLNVTETKSFNHSIHSAVRYDLIGKLSEGTKLTRQTIAQILQGIEKGIFDQYPSNPEDFIAKASNLINEQKATEIIECIFYNPIDEVYDSAIFTNSASATLSYIPEGEPLKRHIYDYVATDSKIERDFATVLDTSAEVVVYAKLPRAFFIPTPVGNYNPDWAIAFEEGKVKHIYFIAETKGSLSSLELRKVEECKIQCAKRFFQNITEKTNGQVKYGVITNYENLLQLVR